MNSVTMLHWILLNTGGQITVQQHQRINLRMHLKKEITSLKSLADIAEVFNILQHNICY